MEDTDLRQCPYCAEEIRTLAIKCRYCGSFVDGRASARTWYRSADGKMVAGVCMGLAHEFDMPVTVIRLAFALASLFGVLTGVVIYAILWVVMPYDDAPV